MTIAMDWLETKAPGFDILGDDEVDAITDFSLLWSLFESRVVNKNANSSALCNLVKTWHSSGSLVPELFDQEIEYFQQRYHPAEEFTNHFYGLRLQRSDREPLVRRVLNGTDKDAVHRQCAALVIVYRYRNNLFHGEKWVYGLKNQLGNFNAANTLLIKALDRYGNL